MLAAKALGSLHVCKGSPEPSSQYRNIMCRLKWRFLSSYVNSEWCGESAPATTGLLCNNQCVVPMRQKCSQCCVIKFLNKTFASLPRMKKYKVVIVFGCYFMGIWQQLRLDMQISLSLGSYTRKKHLSWQNSRTLLDLQAKPWIKSPIAWQSHKLQCYGW